MISSLRIHPAPSGDVPRSYNWAHTVPFLKQNPEITFTPGLNILFGPNGSGKSNVTGILAFHLAAEQGGHSCVTSDWIRNVFGIVGEPQLPWDVVHDGQPVVYVNPRNAVGLIGGMAGFDNDFFNEGIQNTITKASSGQHTLRRITNAAQLLLGAAPFPSKIEFKAGRTPKLAPKIDAHFAATCPLGPNTVILDEPESGLSLPFQAGFWRNALASVAAQKFQIIVATHSPFALNIKGANYIETEPGYLQQCRDLFKTLDR